MKIEWRTILGASFFLLIIFVLYLAWSNEATGSVLLFFGFAAYLMLGGFLVLQWLKRRRNPRPEDREDGNYADTANEPIAFFPSASIWPAGIGIGATFIGVALIWGNWYFVLGLPLVFGSIIGLVVESEASAVVPEWPDEVHDEHAGPGAPEPPTAAASPPASTDA